MTQKSSLFAGLVVVGAFAIGRYLAPDPAPPAAPAPIVRTIAAPGTTNTVVREREIVREVDRAPAAAEDKAALPPEQIERHETARTKARAVVDAAVHAGRWTRADAQALLEVLPNLDREGADEVMTALIVPINAGHVKVETSGSLLDPT